MRTRFRLFPQPPFGDDWALPEVVEVSSPAGSLGSGPSDHRMYVVEPVGKRSPYGKIGRRGGQDFIFLPPWRSKALAPVLPDERGHFDYLQPWDDGFEAAHAFGAIRFTLDVWESYLGRPVDWHFAPDFDRLEISILPSWDNAQFGYGFLEIGSEFEAGGRRLSFALDFDVLSHETGHAILYSLLGLPDPRLERPDYAGIQESLADLVSLIAVMHFPSVLHEVLQSTHGNLYRANHLSRFSEFSRSRQLRQASNDRTLYEFEGGFANEHDLSLPLTGAAFDLLIDVFHMNLVAAGLIGISLDELSDEAEREDGYWDLVQAEFDEAFAGRLEAFYAALTDARDTVARLLLRAVELADPNGLSFAGLLRALIAADREMSGGELERLVRTDFGDRGIGVARTGPRLGRPPWMARRARRGVARRRAA